MNTAIGWVKGFIFYLALRIFLISFSLFSFHAYANDDKKDGLASDPLTTAIQKLCEQSLLNKNKRAFTPVRDTASSSSPQDLWQDFNELLDAAKARKFASSDTSLGVYAPAFRKTSWMMPNPSLNAESANVMVAQLAKLEPISFPEHLANLKMIESSIENPEWGLFGPHSALWKVLSVFGDMINFGAMNYLQLASPIGAQGVFDHSKLLEDPSGRMRQTAKYIYQIIFNPWEDVQKISVGLFKGHSRVIGKFPESVGPYEKGESYTALNPEALTWVYATRFIAWLDAHDILSPKPLDNYEREQAYQESKIFALIFGIPLNALPRTFADFYKYYQYYLESDRLTVGPAALLIQKHFAKMRERFLLNVLGMELMSLSYLSIGPTLLVYGAIKRGTESMSSFYMPAHINKGFGFSFSNTENSFNAVVTKRLADALTKRGLTTLPAWEIAMARIKGGEVSKSTLNRHHLITGEKR